MSYQKAGAPSYASSLRGDPPPYKQSRLGRSGANPPPMLPSILERNRYNKGSAPSNAGSHLGQYSQAHSRTQKPAGVDSCRPKKVFYDDDSATISNPINQFDQSGTDSCYVIDSMSKLSLNTVQESNSVVMGRCMYWERPKGMPSTSSKVSKCGPRSDRPYPKPPTREYSISYKRVPNQAPMEQAGFREYAIFLRSEFAIGTIVRRNVHEPDYKGPALPAFAPGSQASQTSTLVGKGDGRGRKEHRSNGDFGPIYSEDRYFIVVSLCKITYYAIPLYTHDKRGLTHVAEKEDWISVRDHREPDLCRQQSDHVPLCTTVMNPDARILNPVTAAWLPYAVPIRYSVPVAYQGRLDPASTARVRKLFLEHLGGER